MDKTEAIIVRVTIKKVETLFLAQSPDLPGMHVSGRDAASALAKVPGAIKQMLSYGGGGDYIIARANTSTPGHPVFVAVPAGVADTAELCDERSAARR